MTSYCGRGIKWRAGDLGSELYVEVEGLYELEVLHFNEALGIQWKPELLETQVFRHQVKGDIRLYTMDL